MNEDFEHMPLSDLIQDDYWNCNNLYQVFGPNFDMAALNMGSVDTISDNHSVWNPKSISIKISTAAYHQLNLKSSNSEQWPG